MSKQTTEPAKTAAPAAATTTSTSAPTPAKSLKKISFAKPVKKETKTAYPVFADAQVGNQVAGIAARIKTRQTQIEALEGAQTTDKAELKMFVAPFYFKVNQGKADPPSSVSVESTAGEVLVTFQNRYSQLETEDALRPVLGDLTDQFFRQSFEMKIKGESLPAGQEQAIVDAVTAILQKYNALDALDIKEAIKPTKDFHVARLTKLTPEQNMALEQVCPIVAMVKTSGRGK